MAEQAQFMQQALDLARKGWPAVAPNPMVGCVIVQAGKAVAQGYHHQYGAPHAEVMAIQALPPGIDPATCDLYVTLEPCSHFGKTPPCADLIIAKGFRKVIVACKDPNPLVAGRGIAKLEQAGITVTVGLLEAKARELNRRFVTFHEKHRPYYILKWAQTEDGFMSRPLPVARAANRITGPQADVLVHEYRAESMAILVGKNTALADDPKLTTRLVKGKSPLRLLIDPQLEVPLTHHLYDQEASLLVFNARKNATEGNIQWVQLDFAADVLQQVSKKLVERAIQSVLVEGGRFVLDSFLRAGLWDEVLVFVNPGLKFGEGLKAPVIELPTDFTRVGDDKLYRLSRPMR